MRSERGYSLPELMVGLAMGLIVIFAALSLLQVVNRSSARTAARVDANQQARPVMERIMDELRSTCLTRGSAPVLSGSTASSISFMHETGTDVSPIPDKRTIELVNGTLTERVYPASPTTPSAAGVWSFSPTPSPTGTRQLLTNVGTASVNGTSVPLFQYFTYVNAQISPTALTTPLSATDAARTVQVKVSFSASPLKNPTADSGASVTLSDTALLRFGPPSELSTTSNLPCA